ncbi:Hypothetical protein SMAX5B_014660 [Scophthalmus maximus]|uniref:Uncharacterized protein n=1 Tax=Scophthalmus maximus TaxID=52904 RepID=A0A2U9C392_SCOMX|nr:Hypothetical protein SMAX5B_014660 [Scophthalmus maximus]
MKPHRTGRCSDYTPTKRMASLGGTLMLSVDSTGSDGSIDVSITQLDQCAAEESVRRSDDGICKRGLEQS